jgi:hypothetical protein
MTSALAYLVCGVFAVLAAWHFRMAMGAMTGTSGAVPTVEGKPLFAPSRAATVAVGVVLLGFAGLVAATAGLLTIGLSNAILAWLSYALALGLLARAIGEFRYVGFFKKVRDSRFAKLDTLVYSPLCLALSAGVAGVAFRSGVAS